MDLVHDGVRAREVDVLEDARVERWVRVAELAVDLAVEADQDGLSGAHIPDPATETDAHSR
jgi:hypothetical protein